MTNKIIIIKTVRLRGHDLDVEKSLSSGYFLHDKPKAVFDLSSVRGKVVYLDDCFFFFRKFHI